jgi:hypothetical protein
MRATIGVVDNFRSEEALVLYIEKQRQQAEQVVLVYEAGPLGYTLYRKLTATGCSVTFVRPIAVSFTVSAGAH